MASVLHVSTHDVIGGAAIAAYRLHNSLRRLGISSRMAVSRSASGDPDVAVVESSDSRLRARIRRRLERNRMAAERSRYAGTASPTPELFSDDRVPGPDAFTAGLPSADVYNLHWVAGFVDYRRFFARLAAGTPMVWTLHDMNPLTGGCHYSLGCDGFTSGCGACPQLGSRDAGDLSRRIFERKTQALARLVPETTRIVAPSAWLAREARRSRLFGRFQVDVVPHGLDCEVFRPRDRAAARELFGLPESGRVILFAADNAAAHRKGLDLLQHALKGLPSDPPVTLAVMGSLPGRVELPEQVVVLGRLETGRMLSFAYSAADLLVMPTRADNLPNVVAEAMACGTPVAAFDVGGLPDMVRPGETGLLAPAEDVGALRGAIVTLLGDSGLRERMSAECRRVALREFELERQARRYAGLYEEVVENARRLGRRASADREIAGALASPG